MYLSLLLGYKLHAAVSVAVSMNMMWGFPMLLVARQCTWCQGSATGVCSLLLIVRLFYSLATYISPLNVKRDQICLHICCLYQRQLLWTITHIESFHKIYHYNIYFVVKKSAYHCNLILLHTILFNRYNAILLAFESVSVFLNIWYSLMCDSLIIANPVTWNSFTTSADKK
jgi:hypothetical protein